jgi:hypothetical protein
MTVPGQPAIELSDETATAFLRSELEDPILDELYAHLWMVGTPCSSHIDPLYDHAIKGRRVTITEDAKLHLIWIRDIVYLKPIPEYLLNYAFWKRYLCTRPPHPPHPPHPAHPAVRPLPFHHLKKALGYLRSYALLFQHRSDLRLAMDAYLLPSHLDWTFPYS